MNIRGFVLTSFVCAIALVGGACSDAGQPSGPDDGYEPNPVAPVPVTGVRVTPQVIQFAAIGANQQVTATVAPLDATDQGVYWASSDSSVATVDPTGRVTARKAGVGVFITAYTRDGYHEASVNVSVMP